METPVVEASPRKKALCPFCGEPFEYKGGGRYVCSCGEFLREEAPAAPPEPKATRESSPWPELVEGTSGRMRQAMIDVATVPRGHADDPGPCQGHGGKGGGGGSGRGKSQARQKYDAWVRRQMPGRRARSIRIE